MMFLYNPLQNMDNYPPGYREPIEYPCEYQIRLDGEDEAIKMGTITLEFDCEIQARRYFDALSSFEDCIDLVEIVTFHESSWSDPENDRCGHEWDGEENILVSNY